MKIPNSCNEKYCNKKENKSQGMQRVNTVKASQAGNQHKQADKSQKWKIQLTSI